MHLLYDLDASQVKIYRYDDLKVGPRSMPVVNQWEDGKTELQSTCSFNVNVADNTVTLQDNGNIIEIGSQLIYVVVVQS